MEASWGKFTLGLNETTNPATDRWMNTVSESLSHDEKITQYFVVPPSRPGAGTRYAI